MWVRVCTRALNDEQNYKYIMFESSIMVLVQFNGPICSVNLYNGFLLRTCYACWMFFWKENLLGSF